MSKDEAPRAYQKKDPTSTAEVGSGLGVRYGAQGERVSLYTMYTMYTRSA